MHHVGTFGEHLGELRSPEGVAEVVWPFGWGAVDELTVGVAHVVDFVEDELVWVGEVEESEDAGE